VSISLTDFLLARIAEDERRANRAIAEVKSSIWYAKHDFMGNYDNEESSCVSGHDYDDPAKYLLPFIYGSESEVAEHIATFDPARILAECAAKRAVIAAQPKITRFPNSMPITNDRWCDDYVEFEWIGSTERHRLSVKEFMVRFAVSEVPMTCLQTCSR
jgi:hypothetical protein